MGHGGLIALDDTTPLNGPSIDPAVRIGWVVRTARLLRQEPGNRRLEDLARRTGSNATRLHRLETGQLRDGLLVDAYERALDLPGGSLRAPIDIMCRTFRRSSPRDRAPGAPIDRVHDLSRLTELLLDEGQHPTGGQWLDWARAVSQPGAIGLPDFLAQPLVHRLASELGRSVSHGYPSRYEALSLLRCSAYGGVVLAVAREVVADPHVQGLLDLMSAVGESVTPAAVGWCLDLLDDPRDRVVTGGALALENMGQITDAATFWDPLVPTLVGRLAAAEEGGHRWEWLSHLLRLVPQPVREGHDVRAALPLAPLADIPDWSRTHRNRHWMACRARAAEIARRLGLPDEPVLARLLFDIAVSPWESRAVTSYMLVGAVPRSRRWSATGWPRSRRRPATRCSRPAPYAACRAPSTAPSPPRPSAGWPVRTRCSATARCGWPARPAGWSPSRCSRRRCAPAAAPRRTPPA
ncbi:hypothetical protein [Nocardioides euryhalodurans]|uniref:Uncharacterized protein n=1 Tax=Nocardioides euryhalodurans TaxID=2518370 RepID=A0A4P7GNB3_9ACTN|nr:hypothetical protein [Nocardioides euryhalodurans]QBR93384.1 hypothetical protein EXE57_14750 [Nocardioides euryhalodurans]